MPTLSTLFSGKTPEQVRAELYGALRGVGYVKHTGKGTGSVGVTGTAKAASSIVVEVLASGTAGASGSVRYSIDGGQVWTTLSTIPSTPVSISSVGVTVSFAGDFVQGDSYRCETTVPRFAPTAWQPFSVPAVLTDIFAKGLSDLTDLVCAVGRGGLLDYSEGAWLTLLAAQSYGVGRIPAQAARMSFSVHNASGTSRTFATGALLVHDTAGHRYQSVEPATILDGASANVEFTALEAGVGPTIVSGSLQMEQSIAGVSVATRDDAESAGIVLAGRDEETDAELRERCKGRWGTLARSMNDDGYASIIQDSVQTVTRVAATPSMFNAGHVDIRIANAHGGATPAEVAAAEAALKDIVPTGLTADVAACSSVHVDVSCTLSVRAGYEDAARQAVMDGLSALFAACPIGGHVVGSRRILSREAIVAVCQTAVGVVDSNVAEPSEDVSLSAGQVPSVGDVSISIESV